MSGFEGRLQCLVADVTAPKQDVFAQAFVK